MKEGYRSWLTGQGYTEKTISSRISDAQKVERFYGPLDDLHASGGFDELLSGLSYTADDERRNLPNPTRIPTEGNLRTNLASYKGAAALYRRFLAEAAEPGAAVTEDETTTDAAAPGPATAEKQRLSLERDMQSALRRDIARLEPGLTIIDGGAERYVDSGFIDILCKDSEGRLVVVELKAGKPDAKVIGQTLGYMGDLMSEEPGAELRGIIVAHDFDVRTRSAARAARALSLVRYSISFLFEPEPCL